VPKYRYIGPGPIEVITGGEITRPGDEREFEEEPTWGPWELIEEPQDAPGPRRIGDDVPIGGLPASPLAAPITPKGM
jgi:hypothetical protein